MSAKPVAVVAAIMILAAILTHSKVSEKEKELKRINSEAFRTSLEVKGKADAEAAQIYADAYNRDPEFYSFCRSLETLEKSIGDNSKAVLSTESELFKYLKNSQFSQP